MARIIQLCQRIITLAAAIMLVVSFPLPALADDQPAAPTPASNTGPNAPQGPDANTYTYNPATGMWENDYYIWNPATGQTTPKTPQTYSYNPATGHWDTTDWIYDPTSGQYVPNTVSVDQPPAGAATSGGPSSNTSTSAPSAATSSSTQGPNSPASNTSTSNGLFDNFYNAAISNSITAQALSGNAAVTLNTVGGSATTGNAMDIANIINLLQSTTNLQGNLATFSIDVPNNVQGDITIDPGQIPSGSNLGSNNQPTNSSVTINSQGSGQINNDITLGAASGNATVSSNTTAGNATTGSAQTIANIMNVLNSIIASGKSFVGTINIKGNFDGDILLPPSALNNLLAANTSGPNSPTATNTSNNLTATLTNNTGITNTLNLSAASGSASVTDNTSAGSAKTGSASTNITLLNLTGRQVVGSDALLVFVNVMGSWVGMIVNAPAGATSAALCNCSSSTQGPNSPVSGNQNNTTDIKAITNNSINNNIKLSSQSGNATVSDNTTAGNAVSGNAMAGANILNMSNSSFSLANWFGILFINVFGDWTGSFGINTAAGNPKAPSGSGGPSNVRQTVQAVKVFGFIPKAGSSSSSFKIVPIVTAIAPTLSSNSENQQPGQQNAVLATGENHQPPAATAHSSRVSMLWLSGSLFLLGGVLGAEEFISRRQQARQKLRRYLHSITVAPLKKY